MNKDDLKQAILILLKDKEVQEAVADFIWDMPIKRVGIYEALGSSEAAKVFIETDGENND